MSFQFPQMFDVTQVRPFVMCCVETCFGEVKASKLCSRHLQQQYRHGEIVERTRFDPNAVEIFETYALVSLYNRFGAVIDKAVIDLEDVNRISQYVWSFSKTETDGLAYAFNTAVGPMHKFVMKSDEEFDHVDRNGLNNRKTNLRPCTRNQNIANTRLIRKSNNSGARGVCWNKRRQKFTAQIGVNGKQVFLGAFVDLVSAAKAYNEAAVKYYGEFATLNNLETLFKG